MFFAPFNSFALNYTINFSGAGASSIVDSVIVQNLTQGTTVIVPAGNGLYLSDIPNSIDQHIKNEQLVRICPNPLRDKSIVSFFANQSGNTQIKVFGIGGIMIVEKYKTLYVGDNSFQISVPKGAYAISIAGNGYSYAAKMISQASANSKPEIDFLENIENETSISTKSIVSVPLRSSSATTFMIYTQGDRLLFKGISGNNSKIVTDIPIQSKTITFNFVDCTDGDGNHYAVVQIGNQIWMAENLKTTKYNNGTSIPYVTDRAPWLALSTPGYCWHNNEVKYNWYTVNTGNLAPTGWHVPTDAEWTSLIIYLGGESVAGGKLKEAGTLHWASPNTGATNETGFTGLPGGLRGPNGTFYATGLDGYWWSSTQYNTNYAWFRNLHYYYSSANTNYNYKQYGLSVRCVQDN